GQVLASTSWLRESIALDVRLRLIPDSPIPLKHNAAVTLHIGTSETPARVRLLDSQELEPGGEGWAQARLQDPIAAVKGDLFIIRSHQGTLGGGEVVETQPKRHKRFHGATLERLGVLAKGTPEEVLIKALETSEPASVKNLVQRSGVVEETAIDALVSLLEGNQIVVLGKKGLKSNPQLYSAEGWRRLAERGQAFLEEYHKGNPLRAGAPKEEFRGRLRLSQQPFPQVMAKLEEEGVLVEEGALVRLPSHRPVPSESQQKEVDAYLKALESNPYSPPTDTRILPDLLTGLVEQGKVVRVSGDVVFGASAYQKMVDEVVKEIESEGKVTVARVRDMFNTSRKYALALMEYLDQQKVTRRVGDDRVLR
ncbi:MAG: SelB C-terminal domain-containing protein, partial [Dehalococcoidia bacterium]